ncbi:hypothetical protein RJT34_18090 [Clitoria ternatea]|uniref:Uncharacterized protein n=1 Tax=Clitoria ternatea TaxID=43366 RepID=A0AAN9JA48_CLITE
MLGVKLEASFDVDLWVLENEWGRGVEIEAYLEPIIFSTLIMSQLGTRAACSLVICQTFMVPLFLHFNLFRDLIISYLGFLFSLPRKQPTTITPKIYGSSRGSPFPRRRKHPRGQPQTRSTILSFPLKVSVVSSTTTSLPSTTNYTDFVNLGTKLIGDDVVVVHMQTHSWNFRALDCKIKHMVRETVCDVVFLHNELFFVATQKR